MQGEGCPSPMRLRHVWMGMRKSDEGRTRTGRTHLSIAQRPERRRRAPYLIAQSEEGTNGMLINAMSLTTRHITQTQIAGQLS